MEPKWLQNGSLEASGRPLEASGRPLGGHPAATSIFDRFSAPFWLPFWSQNGPKLKPDFEEKNGSDLNRLFLSSGGVWGAFLIDLGLILGSFLRFFRLWGPASETEPCGPEQMRTNTIIYLIFEKS